MRVEQWVEFSCHMENYISERTLAKYTVGSIDFMGLIDRFGYTRVVAAALILKYTIRILNGKQKEHDLEKIVHYAQILWSSGNEKREIEVL